MKRNLYELFVVGSAFLLLGGSAHYYILPAANVLYESDGIIRIVLEVSGTITGGNLDLSVAAVAGVACGWLLLFLIDGTKRTQAPFVALAVGLAVVPFLNQADRVVDTVQREPVAFVVGAIVGVVIGLALATTYEGRRSSSTLDRIKWLQFPITTYLLQLCVTVYVVLIVIEYGVSTAPVVDRLLTTIAGIGLVASLNVFLTHRHQQKIISISPTGNEVYGSTNYDVKRYEPYVMGGLFRYALDNHNGFIMSDQDSIGSGAGRLDQAQSTDSFDRLVPFPSEVSFGCRVRSTLSNPSEAVRAILSRTVVVVARGLTAESIDNEQLRGQPDEDPQFDPVPMEKKTNTGTVVSRRLADLARSLGWKAWNCFLLTLPPSNWVEKVVPRGIHAEIERADTVLLLAPALRRGEKPPAGTRAYSDICASYAYRIDIDIVFVPIEVNRVLDTEDENRDGDMLKRTLRSRVGINSDRCEVVPVNRFYGGEYRGFGELLEKTGA